MRRIRRKHERPAHPWQAERIKEEKELNKEYRCKNKKEIWKMVSMVRDWRRQAKKLIALRGTRQQELEEKQLLTKLNKFNLLPKNAKLEDVLILATKDIMERRIQTILFRKKLAKTIKHARQLITHGKVYIDSKRITSPSKVLNIKEEEMLKVKA